MTSSSRGRWVGVSVLLLVSQLANAGGFPGVLVDANSEEGQARLARAKVRADLDALTFHFEAQTNPALSGAASATIVLNALRTKRIRARARAAAAAGFAASTPGKPPALPALPPGFDPFYMRYTQAGFFTPATDKVKTLPEVLGATHTAHVGAHPDAGFRLGQYARALRAHGLKVEARLTDGSQNAAQIRAELISNLAERGNFVIVKYNRIALGQLGGNHISPLGAYDDRSDSFLVMDVDPSVGPWVWIRSSDLIAAMRASDRGDDRGYVLVSDRVADPRVARIASHRRRGTVRTLALEK